MNIWYALLIFSCLSLAGCVAHTTTAMERASYDLDCPEAQLEARNLSGAKRYDPGVVGVDGCSRRATYLCRGETCVLESIDGRVRETTGD